MLSQSILVGEKRKTEKRQTMKNGFIFNSFYVLCRILDGFLPLLFFIISCTLFSIDRYRQYYDTTLLDPDDCLRLPTSKTLSVFKRSIILLIVTLLEISGWAFLFAWRLESAILERGDSPNSKIPPLYQVIDPGLSFIPRVIIVLLQNTAPC